MQSEPQTLNLMEAMQIGLEHHQAGRLAEAESFYRRVLQDDPKNLDALHFLGVIAHQTGKNGIAVQLIDAALAINPEYAEALSNRGLALHELKRYDEALASCDKALSINPEYAEAYSNRGNALHELKRYEEALASYDKALSIRPGFAQAWSNRGNALYALNRHDEAVASFDTALSVNPEYAEAHSNRGNVLHTLKRYAEALASCDRALAIKPDSAEALFNRALTLQSLNRSDEALASYDRALAIKPDYAVALCNRGNVLKDRGRLDDALANFRRALALAPDFDQAHSNAIFVLDLMEGRGVEEQQEERKRWYAMHGRKHAEAIRPHDNSPDLGRKLRIGYVSADFRRHAASYAFGPIMRLQDRAAFEVVCYSGVTLEDDVTAGLKQASDTWRSTLGLSDEALAEQIRRDRIDILVDLSSHMSGNRLPVFARKPAPVQVTAWGYPNGTGMPTIDYLFSDAVVIPRNERSLFAEEVIDLPCFLCYEPPAYLPEVGPLPVLSGRPFTFGCISRIEKISDGALRLWGRILAEVPEARLLIKAQALDDPEHRRRFIGRLDAAGIGEARVRLIGQTSHVELLRTFHEVDLALDPFPHGGAIGTAEALWMGVPVVTLRGATFMSRISASILTALGMGEWIARDAEDYLRMAVQASRDLGALAQTRARMRSRLAGTIFGNADRYTRAVESAYRTMWRRWCAERISLPNAIQPVPQTVALTQAMQVGLEHHRAGRLAQAEGAFRQVLQVDPRNLDALHSLGVIAHQTEHDGDALQLIDSALSIAPDYTEALSNRGLVLHQLGRYDEALASYDKALSVRPDFVEALSNRGNSLFALSRCEEALASYDSALSLRPGYSEALFNRGNALHSLLRYGDALASYDKALSLRSDYAEAFSNRGLTLLKLQRYDEALASCEKALSLKPDLAAALSHRGDVLQELERFDEALADYDRALLLNPAYARVLLLNSGLALQRLGRYGDALANYEKALSIEPDFAEVLVDRGDALHELQRYEEALASYDRALLLGPARPRVLSNRGNALLRLGRHGEALASYERALSLQRDYPDALSNRGIALQALGRVDEALGSYRAALALSPGHAGAHSNAIFVLDLVEGCGVEEQQAERKRWYAMHGLKYAASIRPFNNVADPGRKLRIGYVSADFRRHAASYSFGPVIRLHDRAAFEVVCYSGVAREDDVTAGLKQASDTWRSTVGVSDEALAEQVRRDKIDILVDLSSHMAGNRLPVFARKPAPVQVTAWGYPNGTGLPTIDYLFSDTIVIPKKERRLFAEEVIDLPCFLCYEPPNYLPEVAPLPALSAKPFTFGCISRLEKISDGALRLWGRILAAAPGSRLLVRAQALDDPEHRRRFIDRLGAAGIGEARVCLVGRSSHEAILQTFNEVDLALDPFPHGGAIGTAEALWMGVPVVTMRGATFMSRISASILTALEMGEWIARDEKGYLSRAVKAARNLKGLARTRAQMRSRLEGSIFGNAQGYTREVETAYRTMWRRWCDER